MRRDCSFGSKLLVVGGWSLVVGLIVAWVLSWCGSYRGAVLLGRCPRKFPSTLTIATRRLAALVFAARSWCGSPGPQSAQSSAHPACTRRLAALVFAAREDRTTFKAPRTGPHHVLEDPRLDKPRVQAPSFPLTIDKVWI